MKKYVVSFADLGTKGNLKQDPTLMVYDALYKVDSNSELYIRNNYDFKKYMTRNILPFGNKLPFLFEILKKYLFESFNARGFSLYLMDTLVTKKIASKAELVYVIPPTFPKLIRRVYNNNNITIMHSGVNHPFFCKKLEKNTIKKNEPLLKTIENSKYIFAISSLTKQTYVDNGFEKNNIYVTQLGVDTKKFRPKKQEDNVFRVMCIGDYSKLKGFDLVLQAWRSLNLKNAELVFVGNPNEDMKDILKLYKRLLKNFKTYSHTDPLSFYQNSSVLVHPSLSDSWGKVVTEAMACGLPVIVSENTGAKDAVIDNKTGFIIPTNSVKAIEEKLLYLYNNQKKAQEMGKKARKHVEENFTWEKSTEKAYQAFKEIIKREKLE